MRELDAVREVRVVCARENLFNHCARIIDVETGDVLAVSEPMALPEDAIADARLMICENEREVAT